MATATQQKTVTYLADGTKAIDTTIENGAAKYSAKLGSLIYEFENNQEKFSVLTDGGIIVWNYSTGQKETLQYIKDHLGSVRVIMQNGRPAAFNEYEPFGRFEQEYSYNKFQNVTLPAAKNKFLFNGKEEMLGRDIGMLDFGARIYDPTIARWNSVDPMAIKYHKVSPYAYCINSPIMYIDPDGRTIFLHDDTTNEKVEYKPYMIYRGESVTIKMAVAALNLAYITTPGMQKLKTLL